MRAKIPEARLGADAVGKSSADTSDAVPMLAIEGWTVSDSALPVLLDSPSSLVRARRLFEFLTRAQELRAPRVRDVSSYEYVLWLGNLPDHESVSYGSDASELDREVLTVSRVQRSPAPAAPRDVAPWLVSAVEQPNATPALAASRRSGTHGTPPPSDQDSGELRLADQPEIESSFQTWLPEWRRWAERERNVLQLQEIYKQLFNAYVKTSSRSDEYELVIATVCLAWHPAGGQPRPSTSPRCSAHSGSRR